MKRKMIKAKESEAYIFEDKIIGYDIINYPEGEETLVIVAVTPVGMFRISDIYKTLTGARKALKKLAKEKEND